MNFRIIAYIVGWVCNFQAAFMMLPLLTAGIYREKDFSAFLLVMLVCLVVGVPLTRKKPKNKVFYIKDGCVAVALSWLALCIFGSIPFVVSGCIPHPIDALFETVSGFTTTGSSILSDVEVLPHCILIWRSFTHWIGGPRVPAFSSSACRRLSYEPYESREPGAFRQQTCPEGTVHCKDPLYDLLWNDTDPVGSASDWQGSAF